MDMMIAAGKSRKNIEAFVLMPPDTVQAINLLLETRREVGIPEGNKFLFARPNANTPFTGNTELSEYASMCPGLQHPERITSRGLRKYIATVSQVSSQTNPTVKDLIRDAILLTISAIPLNSLDIHFVGVPSLI